MLQYHNPMSAIYTYVEVGCGSQGREMDKGIMSKEVRKGLWGRLSMRLEPARP